MSALALLCLSQTLLTGTLAGPAAAEELVSVEGVLATEELLAAEQQVATGELVAVSTSTTPPILYNGPHGPIIVTAVAKAFRAAPQNGSNNLIIVYSCAVVGATDGTVTPIRSHVNTCLVDTDGPTDRNYVGMVTQGPAATSTGRDTLAGSRARICVSGSIRYSDNVLGTTPLSCGDIALAL